MNMLNMLPHISLLFELFLTNYTRMLSHFRMHILDMIVKINLSCEFLLAYRTYFNVLNWLMMNRIMILLCLFRLELFETIITAIKSLPIMPMLKCLTSKFLGKPVTFG